MRYNRTGKDAPQSLQLWESSQRAAVHPTIVLQLICVPHLLAKCCKQVETGFIQAVRRVLTGCDLQ